MDPFKEELIHRDSPFPVDIFIRDNTKERIVAEPHWHDCCEILYMLEGSAEQRINDKYFNARKDDLIILNKGDIHGTWCNTGEDVRILVIKFLPELISSSSARINESKYIVSFLNNGGEKIYHLSEASKNSAGIYQLMMGLYEEFTFKDTGFEIYIKGYIYQLIASLVRSGILTTSDALDSMGLEKLDGLFLYIEKNYHQDINLKTAADILNLSYSYFSRVFKRITGRTFKEYIDYVRICEAEKLIVTGNMNITQAAYASGFCNVTSFNRVYKRVRGYQPGTLKKTKTAKK